MSLTIILIGAAHGVPVVLASAISKRKWVVISVAFGMLYVALSTGAQAYLAADVLGIIAGTIFAWFLPKQPEPVEISTNPKITKAIEKAGEEQCRRYEYNQWLDKAAKEFGSKLLVQWSREGLWKENTDYYAFERKRSICEKFVRCSFDPSRAHQLLDEDFLKEIVSEAKDYAAFERMCSRAFLECLDLGMFPLKQTEKFRDDFKRAYEEERKRQADERWRHAAELAKQVLDRQERPARK